MKPRNAENIEVQRTGSALRIRILRRISFKPVAIVSIFILICALALPAIVFIIAADASLKFRVLCAVAFLPFSLIPALWMISRLLQEWEFLRQEGTLTVTTTGMLGTRVRRRPWPGCTLSVPKVGTTSREIGPDDPVHELRIDYPDERPIRLLKHADADVLRWLAQELRSEVAPAAPALKPGAVLSPPIARPKPAWSRAQSDAVPGGLRITLPPLGIFTPQKNGALVGALVLPTFSILIGAAILVLRSHFGPILPIVWTVLGLFVAVGLLITIFEVNKRVRQGSLEATSEGLGIRVRSLFGSRRQYWPASKIREICGEYSGSTTNGVPQMQLRITLAGEESFKGFQGRERDELDWIASEVSRTLASAGAVLKPSLGTCKICGSGLARGIVLCVRCRTPHHQECWQYTGQCSTFGCREIRYVRE